MLLTRKMAAFLFLILLAAISVGYYAREDVGKQFLAVLVSQGTISPEYLKSKYKNNGEVRILIVPGHDDESPGGTQFRGVREADLNLRLANDLSKAFNSDRHFLTFTTRDEHGYKPEFASYFLKNRYNIISFRDRAKKVMDNLLSRGLVEERTFIHHNTATEDDSIKLYGINKWANDSSIDLVLHIHFNDYPNRPRKWAGKYSGFSIYIPENQLPNHRASLEMAQSVLSQLDKYFPISDHPIEKVGIIEDQELIAVGSNASLDVPALLIEYGYIYESQFVDPNIQPLIMKEFAYQTYQGIKKFFDPLAETFPNSTSILPHIWGKYLKKGSKNNSDVLALQAALLQENLYPPKGFTKNQCPLTGNFGNCTYVAVTSFQKEQGIPSTGFVGPLTISRLNKLYSYSAEEFTEDFAYTWNQDLYYGLKNDPGVTALQDALILEGVYKGPVTGNFFELTRRGVMKFQTKHNFTVVPGTGYVGPYTRKVLNEIYSK